MSCICNFSTHLIGQKSYDMQSINIAIRHFYEPSLRRAMTNNITNAPVQVMNVLVLNVTMETVACLLMSVMSMMTVETTVMRTTVLEVSIMMMF